MTPSTPDSFSISAIPSAVLGCCGAERQKFEVHNAVWYMRLDGLPGVRLAPTPNLTMTLVQPPDTGERRCRRNTQSVDQMIKEDAQPVKVLVFRHKQAAAILGQLPHRQVRRAASADLPNVQRVGEHVAQQNRQVFRQLLVAE